MAALEVLRDASIVGFFHRSILLRGLAQALGLEPLVPEMDWRLVMGVWGKACIFSELSGQGRNIRTEYLRGHWVQGSSSHSCSSVEM